MLGLKMSHRFMHESCANEGPAGILFFLAAITPMAFLMSGNTAPIENHLAVFCRLDDHDIMVTIKNWSQHPDKILSALCGLLTERKLLKVKLQAEPLEETLLREKLKEACEKLGINEKEAGYFVFTGEASNTTYDPRDERINILFKDGTVKDISKVDNALIHQHLSITIKKYYICYLR